MKNFLSKDKLLVTSLLVGFAAAAPGFAVAQEKAVSKTEEIVVTGTRVARPDAVSNSPINTVTAEALTALNTVNVEQQLRLLPQFLPGSGEFTNNDTTPGRVEGTATVNLRGLGTNRTLVLMDGKRLPPFNGSGAIDTNLIPVATLERVDVVTGGASAVYGSDAVAGVVNFITNKRFEGVQIDAGTTQFEEGDGQTKNFSIAMGSNFADDRGNASLTLAYTDRDGLYQGSRDYSRFNLDPSPGAAGIQDPSRRGGSSNAAATRANLSGIGNRHFTPDGNLVAAAALPLGNNNLRNNNFNFNPFNYFQVPQERWQATAAVNYRVNQYFDFYSRAIFADSTVPSELASSAYFGGSTTDFQVNLDNPFLTAAQRAVLATAYFNETGNTYSPTAAAGSQLVTVAGIRRRLLELGNRIGINDTQTYQMMSGIRGDLADTGWTYDISGSFGRVKFFSGTQNDVSTARAREALLAIPSPTGPVCIVGGSCAPVNIFSGSGAVDPTTGLPATGSISQAALDYIRAAYYSQQSTDQQVVNAQVSGDLDFLKSPAADAPVGVALGAEYKRDFTSFNPDDLTRTGGAMGQGGTAPPVKGATESLEYFAEALVPLASDKPFMKSLGLELGVRYSDTNLAGEFTTWKAGGEWMPVDDLRFRAMAQRAVRAPNVDEFFSPVAFGLVEITNDPCAGAAPVTNAALRAKCIAQGAPAGTIGNIQGPAAQQAGEISGGAIPLGVSLTPETADTYTVGFQVSPSFLSGFTASVDYYTIEVADAIAAYPAQEIVNNCFTANINSFCSLLKRNVLGELEGDGFGIQRDTRNLSQLKAEGIDYTASYSVDLGDVGFLKAATLTFDLAGSYLMESSTKSSPASALIECQGFYGPTCGDPNPEHRFNLRSGLAAGPLDVGLTWRYFGSVTQEPGSSFKVPSIDAFNWFDLSVRYAVRNNVKLTASVQNITNEDPPIVGNIPGANTAMNTYASTYDPLGRRFGLGLSIKY